MGGLLPVFVANRAIVCLLVQRGELTRDHRVTDVLDADAPSVHVSLDGVECLCGHDVLAALRGALQPLHRRINLHLGPRNMVLTS